MIGRSPDYIAGEVAFAIIFEKMDLFPLLGEVGRRCQDGRRY